ncbi:hypothetical protein ACK3TF_005393 [Chlorella vulgaris]
MARTPAALVRNFLAALVLFVSSASAYNGDATAYGSAGGRGSGSCGIRQNLGSFETYYVSLNGAQYSSGKCGSCITACGSRGCATMMVVDHCPSCPHGDIDTSSEALRQLTGKSWDRKPVSWNWSSCGGGGSSTSSRKPSRRKCNCRKDKWSKKCRSQCRRKKSSSKKKRYNKRGL